MELMKLDVGHVVSDQSEMLPDVLNAAQQQLARVQQLAELRENQVIKVNFQISSYSDTNYSCSMTHKLLTSGDIVSHFRYQKLQSPENRALLLVLLQTKYAVSVTALSQNLQYQYTHCQTS